MKYFLTLLAGAMFIMVSFIDAEASIPRLSPDSYPISEYVEEEEIIFAQAETEMNDIIHFTQIFSAKELCDAIEKKLRKLTENAEGNQYPMIFIPYELLEENQWTQVIKEAEKERDLVIDIVKSDDEAEVEGFIFLLP